jgi:hypothetical protein
MSSGTTVIFLGVSVTSSPVTGQRGVRLPEGEIFVFLASLEREGKDEDVLAVLRSERVAQRRPVIV